MAVQVLRLTAMTVPELIAAGVAADDADKADDYADMSDL